MVSIEEVSSNISLGLKNETMKYVEMLLVGLQRATAEEGVKLVMCQEDGKVWVTAKHGDVRKEVGHFYAEINSEGEEQCEEADVPEEDDQESVVTENVAQQEVVGEHQRKKRKTDTVMRKFFDMADKHMRQEDIVGRDDAGTVGQVVDDEDPDAKLKFVLQTKDWKEKLETATKDELEQEVEAVHNEYGKNHILEKNLNVKQCIRMMYIYLLVQWLEKNHELTKKAIRKRFGWSRTTELRYYRCGHHMYDLVQNYPWGYAITQFDWFPSAQSLQMLSVDEWEKSVVPKLKGIAQKFIIES
ncbi:hypothetical protein BCR43DRAFT_504143 [Syncephalastrum racemosum]|uniref:Uncharacterized protein n=1 Tax=Syncephalastrum racemosum TaxID=13706 RepID=A0A1X2HFD0_SYNRA|nr:hypothetical protein BCR43DRAFT_504143 [Syncephalastrum racemosum]